MFSEYPSARTISEPLQERPTLSSRAEVAMSARKEMSQSMAKQRVERGIRNNVPSSADTAFKTGEIVLVWREKAQANRFVEWLGTFTVETIDEERKLVFVRDVSVEPAKPFGSSQVKQYHAPEKAADMLLQSLAPHSMNSNLSLSLRFHHRIT